MYLAETIGVILFLFSSVTLPVDTKAIAPLAEKEENQRVATCSGRTGLNQPVDCSAFKLGDKSPSSCTTIQGCIYTPPASHDNFRWFCRHNALYESYYDVCSSCVGTPICCDKKDAIESVALPGARRCTRSSFGVVASRHCQHKEIPKNCNAKSGESEKNRIVEKHRHQRNATFTLIMSGDLPTDLLDPRYPETLSRKENSVVQSLTAFSHALLAVMPKGLTSAGEVGKTTSENYEKAKLVNSYQFTSIELRRSIEARAIGRLAGLNLSLIIYRNNEILSPPEIANLFDDLQESLEQVFCHETSKMIPNKNHRKEEKLAKVTHCTVRVNRSYRRNRRLNRRLNEATFEVIINGEVDEVPYILSNAVNISQSKSFGIVLLQIIEE
eukprot:g5405.t1